MTTYLFDQNAGKQLLSHAEVIAEQSKELDSQTLLRYLESLGFNMDELTVHFDSATATASICGHAVDRETQEKIILCCGNIIGVGRVSDQIEVDDDNARAADWYTVKKGDSLPEIAQIYYQDAQKNILIFLANTPMLDHPDHIFPGQKLRIPPAPRKCVETEIVYRRNRLTDRTRVPQSEQR